MKSKTAFTKKDIVVTFGCAVFLLANLGAVGSSGRRRAKEAVCFSNLRQWGAMFEMFTNDNNGYFMEGFNGVAGTLPDGSDNNRWIKALGAYHKYDTNFSCCPEATMPWYDVNGNDMHLAGTWRATFSAWGYYGPGTGRERAGWLKPFKSSYGINGWVNNPDPGCGFPRKPQKDHWRTPNVRGTNNIPLFLDAGFYNRWPEHTDRPPDYDGQYWAGSDDMVIFCMNRHNGAVNGVFLDFSARKIGLKELWKLKWHRSYNINAPLPPWPEWMKDFTDY